MKYHFDTFLLKEQVFTLTRWGSTLRAIVVQTFSRKNVPSRKAHLRSKDEKNKPILVKRLDAKDTERTLMEDLKDILILMYRRIRYGEPIMIPDDFKEDHIDANFLNYQYSFLDRCAKKLGLID